LLHGLEIGAILAARSFERGLGDALLLWSPPVHANQALRSSLMRWAGLEQLFESAENRRSAADYIRQLEQGLSIEVAGYEWSSSLWRTSFDFQLPANLQDDGVAYETFKRPVKVLKLGREAAPLVKPYVGYDEVKDLSWLYASNFEWVAAALQIPKEDRHEQGN
jgi:hypothetical protein